MASYTRCGSPANLGMSPIGVMNRFCQVNSLVVEATVTRVGQRQLIFGFDLLQYGNAFFEVARGLGRVAFQRDPPWMRCPSPSQTSSLML
ncbi:MAG: hypothetical protein ISS63_08470 [Desulfobacteraceae bacterium]|nr:hypothetical protein [Desulfobacteraceae bacterium]